jgi:4-amino-4-deoxy-L-arabinose transferase-like glycosyltransferase
VSDGAGLGRSDWPWLVSLLLVGCLTLAIFALNAYDFTDGRGGAPLDDAWIHFQFARNLARGDGLSFNPGQPTSGSTAPLWTLLLAAVYFVGGEFPVAGQALSAACFLAALAATYEVGKRLTDSRWAGWLASVVVAINGRMVWAGLSGLETCLFATLTLLAIGAHVSDRAARRYRLRTAALFGLAALSRPEGYLFFALALADLLFALIVQEQEPWRTRWRRFPILPTLLFATIVLPYLIFSLHTSGHLLPNTYRAKATVNLLPDRDFLSLTAKYLILDNPLLLPFFLFGLILLIERASLLSLWSAGLPLVYAFLHAVLYQHGRYLIPLIPCNAVIGVVGLLGARQMAVRRGWRWRGSQTRLAILVSLLVVAGTAWRLPTMASLYAWNVDNVNEMHVALGHWVAENTPPDAVLALNDIGAITYVSERPVVDLAGLVTPEVVPILRGPDRDSKLADFIEEQDVQYVIIFPKWFPDLASRRGVLEPVHQVVLEHNTIVGGETMVVYRANWQR